MTIFSHHLKPQCLPCVKRLFIFYEVAGAGGIWGGGGGHQKKNGLEGRAI